MKTQGARAIALLSIAGAFMIGVTILVGHQLSLLGDNRYDAEDSTFVGPIPFASIVEKEIF